jgi:serine protease Do
MPLRCCFLILAVALRSQAESAPPPAAQPVQASVARAIAQVYPALVQIQVLSPEHSAGREHRQESAGSGIIISPDGYVVTNHHVAGKAVSLRVTLSSKEELDATLVGTDAFTDIAVIKLDLTSRRKDAPPLPSARFGASEALKVGDTVLAMGCPFALSHSVTQGIVANKDLIVTRALGPRMMLDGEDVGALVRWIGHDAAIAPGNSGGPLVNLDGEIIGINELGIGPLSAAIPSELTRAVADELIAHGKVRRAFTGAEFQQLLRTANATSPEEPGVLVSGVLAGSPAASAGLQAGDVVLAVDGAKVQARFREELPSVNLLLLTKPIGAKVSLLVKRGDKQLPLTVTTELRDDAQRNLKDSEELGVTVRPISALMARELDRPDTKGVLISGVRPGGPADQAVPALQRGDVLLEMAGKPVADEAVFFALIKELTPPGPPQPRVVAFERENQKLLTVAEIGLHKPQPPAADARKAWLPVATQVLTRKLATALSLKGKKGVRVTQVFPRSAAVTAGFKVGDVITHIDGLAVEASEPHDNTVFDAMIRAYKLGSKAEFTVLRDGQPLKLTAELDEGPQQEHEMRTYEDVPLELHARDLSLFDRVRRHLTDELKAVLLTQVEAGGWASVGGLRADDLVLAVDGQHINQISDLEAQMQAVAKRHPKQVVFLVRRGAHTLFVELLPKWKQ